MRLSARAKQRLSFIGTVTLAIIVAVAAVAALRHWQDVRRLDQQRAMGAQALAARDHASALAWLQPYVLRRPQDLEALYLYAQARAAVPETGQRHLELATSVLRQIQARQPEWKPPARLLLDLYVRQGADREALALASRLLAKMPGDRDIAQARAVVLARQGRSEEALADAMVYLHAAPGSLDARAMVLYLLFTTRGTDPALDQVRQWRRDQPTDPAWDLMLGLVWRLAGDDTAAAEVLTKAAAADPPGPVFTRMLTQQLDALGRHDLAMDVLQRGADKTADTDVLRELCRRLWLLGRLDRITRSLAWTSTAPGMADPELVALNALALHGLGRRGEAGAMVAALHGRTHDSIARAWASVLPGIMGIESRATAQWLDACHRALEAMPRQPLLLAELATVWESLGEPDLALATWRQAADAWDGWAGACTGVARLALRCGRLDEAEAAARAAVARDSGPAQRQILARVLLRRLAQGRAAVADELDALLADTTAPPMHVIRVLRAAATGSTRDLHAAVTAALETPDLPPGQLLEVAHACGGLDPGLWARCLDEYERRHGQTIAMLESRAQLALARGRGPEAMAVFAGSPGSWPTWQWDLARVKVLEAAGDASAGGEWESLADAHADNHAIQRHALDATSTRNNAPLHDRLIRRLRAATASRGIVWRLAQARQCLRGTPSDADIAAAVTMLHQVIHANPDAGDAQHLLARCLTLLGRTEEARRREELAARSSSLPPPPTP